MLYFRSLVADKSDKTLFYLDVVGDGIRKTNGAITKQRVPIVTVATLGPRYWLLEKGKKNINASSKSLLLQKEILPYS